MLVGLPIYLQNSQTVGLFLTAWWVDKQISVGCLLCIYTTKEKYLRHSKFLGMSNTLSLLFVIVWMNNKNGSFYLFSCCLSLLWHQFSWCFWNLFIMEEVEELGRKNRSLCRMKKSQHKNGSLVKSCVTYTCLDVTSESCVTLLFDQTMKGLVTYPVLSVTLKKPMVSRNDVWLKQFL